MKMVKVIKGKKAIFSFLWIGLMIILLWFVSGNTLASESLALNLNKCIQIALENNLGYRISQSSVDVKEAQIEEAEGSKKTNIKLRGGYIRMNEAPEPDALMEGDFSYLFSSGKGIPQISVNISRVLYSGGKFETFIEQACI